jgi:hypothetical protein
LLYGSPYGRYGEAAFGGSTSPKDGGSAVSGPSDDVIALRHLRAGGGDCFGRLIARWSSFMHVSVYLEAESPCQFPVFQTTHFGALVRLLFHELLGLQLRRLLRWSSIGAREGFYLLCSLLLEPWIKNPYPHLGENRANPLPPICHNISLFLLQAMGLVRAIPLRLRKGTTVFPRQGNRQIHGL